MPISEFPLPISIDQLRQQLAGLGTPLQVQAAYAATSEEDVAAMHIRAAHYEVEGSLMLPFFITKFCAEEVANQDGLVQGTDFDYDYRGADFYLNEWYELRGNLRLDWGPLVTVDKLLLSLPGGTTRFPVPTEWLNVSKSQQMIYIVPYGGVFSTQVVFNMFAFVPLFTAARITGVVPNFAHVRYSAGLVERDGYDPVAFPKNTTASQNMIAAYQLAIAQLAASFLMREIASWLDRGGVSISLDGLSKSVNSGVLENRANGLKQLVDQWIQTTSFKETPLVMAIV